MKQMLALIAGPLAFLVFGLIPFDGLEPAAQNVLALTAWMAIWWVTEAIPMSATALLPVTVLPLLQAIGLETSGGCVLQPHYLFISRWICHGLEHRKMGTAPTARTEHHQKDREQEPLHCAWIHTGHCAVVHVHQQYGHDLDVAAHCPRYAQGARSGTVLRARTDPSLRPCFWASLIRRALRNGHASLAHPPTPSSRQPLMNCLDAVSPFTNGPGALPLALAALILCWLYLTRWKFRFEDRDQPELKKIVQLKLDALGPLSKQELKVLLVFSAVVVLWIGRTLLLQDLLFGSIRRSPWAERSFSSFCLPTDRRGASLSGRT